jgi:hypothetical protein
MILTKDVSQSCWAMYKYVRDFSTDSLNRSGEKIMMTAEGSEDSFDLSEVDTQRT